MFIDTAKINRVKKEIKEANEKLADLNRELKRLENPIYRHGQWFRRDNGELYLLCQVHPQTYCLMCRDGNRWSEPKYIGTHDLTMEEVLRLGNFGSFTSLVPVNIKITEV